MADLRLDEFLPYRLSVAANAVSQVIARAYEAAGLKTNEWRLMAVLAEDGELSQQAIVRRTKLDKVSVSRAAQGLESRGLVRRAQDPADARSLRLTLTPAGKRLHAKVAPAALSLATELVEGIDPEELRALERLLVRIEAQAERMLARP